MGKIKTENEEIAELIQESKQTAFDIKMRNDVMVQTIPNPMGFKSIMEALENDVFVIPSFQRVYRWTEQQVNELVISLVRGMPIPPIYGYRNEKQQIVILDGQQRLISLYLYYKGKAIKRKRNGFIKSKKINNGFKNALKKWELKDKEYEMAYYDSSNDEEKTVDISYNGLSQEVRRLVDFTQLNIVLINVEGTMHQERILYKIFANLNIGGIPLSPQELRNGIYCCDFYDMLHDLNETNKKWRELYGGNKEKEENKESKDIELLLKLCAFRKNVSFFNGKLTLNNYKGKINQMLDDFSEKALDFDEEEIQEYKFALEKFIECIYDITTKNRETLWPCLFVAAEKNNFDIVITKSMCTKIIESDVYREANKSGTSSKTEIETRLRYVYEQICKFS